MKPIYARSFRYLHYWGLRVSPFLHHDSNRFFGGAAQRYVFSQVDEFIASGDRAALLVGKAGYGMTRILEYLSQQAGMGDSAVEMVFSDQLPMSSQNVRTVWLLDQDDRHDRKLLNGTPPGVSLLVAVHENQQKMTIKSLGQYPRTIELSSMSADDARAYVNFAIRMAGGQRMVFTDSAISRMHELSEGRIRDISQLAENALRYSWARQETEIESRVIDLVSRPIRRAG